MKSSDNLFAAFAPVSAQEWKAQIEKDLRGADYYEAVVWKTPFGFDIQPFYTSEVLQRLSKNNLNNNLLYNGVQPGRAARFWENVQRIPVMTDAQANDKALDALKNGADGIQFVLSTTSSLATFEALLKNIHLAHYSISFVVPADDKQFCQTYQAYVAQHQIDIQEIAGQLSFKNQVTDAANDIGLLFKYPNFKAITISQQANDNFSESIGQLLADVVLNVTKWQKNGLAAGDFFNNLVIENSFA